jgi:hypothetical protein
MPPKRQASTWAQAETSTRGRPKRTTHSTYVSASQTQANEEEAPPSQPTIEANQPNPNLTSEQVLQQLQADLHNVQQEWDRLTAAFAASQRAMQVSQQAAEVCQQLEILQTKIQSLQPNQPPSNNSN